MKLSSIWNETQLVHQFHTLFALATFLRKEKFRISNYLYVGRFRWDFQFARYQPIRQIINKVAPEVIIAACFLDPSMHEDPTFYDTVELLADCDFLF